MPKRKQNDVGKSPFSMRLASLRKEKGLNMESLATAVGVSKSYISLLESGGRQPSRDVVLQLARALGGDGSALRDELLILAGFAPVDTQSISAYQDVLSIYEQALALAPDNLQTFSRYVLALIKAGRQAQAQERIQEGLQRFRDIVQLQSLLAYSELGKGHYAAAIVNQETALRQFELQTDSQLRKADLIFNLGSIHFMQGYAAQGHFLANQDPAARSQALASYAKAEALFETARQLAPDDAYILDEFARLRFNQAYLAPSDAAWQATIAIYRQLLTTPHKLVLGAQQLMESAAFMAHAYTQSGALDQAELTLGLLSSFNSSYWLVHYLEACLHCRRYEIDPSAESLSAGLAALARALANDVHGAAHHEAAQDPDLVILRQQRPAEFAQLLKESSPA